MELPVFPIQEACWILLLMIVLDLTLFCFVVEDRMRGGSGISVESVMWDESGIWDKSGIWDESGILDESGIWDESGRWDESGI